MQKRLISGEKVEFVLDLQSKPADCSDAPPVMVAFMEKYGVRHSYSGKKARIQCEDKLALHQIASVLQVPSPFQISLTSQGRLSNQPIYTKDIFPAFIKPRYGQGNFGICEHSRVESSEDLQTKFPLIHAAFPTIDTWVLQKYLPGLEYTIIVIGNGYARETLPIATLKCNEGGLPFKVFDPQNLGGLKPENPN